MRKYGFTIIELLVVIAVIAVLTAISIPALTAAKHRARSMHCNANLRQLSICFMIYQQEQGVFPYGFSDEGLGTTMPEPPGGKPLGSGNDKQGWWWIDFLQGVIDIDCSSGSIVWCPARNAVGLGISNNLLLGNYGVNRSVCRDADGETSCSFSGKPLMTDQVRSPAITFLVSDSGYSLVSWMAAVETSVLSEPVFEHNPRIPYFYIPGFTLNQTRPELYDNPDAIKGRHPGQTLNVGFVDGHNERRKADSLKIESAGGDNHKLPMLWSP